MSFAKNLTRYVNWLDDEVGWLIDPLDRGFESFIPIVGAVMLAIYVAVGWTFIVVVATPIAAIRTFCRWCIR